jgi:hypothetical protein
MFGLSSLKWIAIASIVSAILAGLWHVSNLQANLAVAKKDNEVLKESIKTQQTVIDKQLSDIRQIQSTLIELNENKKLLEIRLKEVDRIFSINANGTSRDFGKITRSKPGLINRIIDKASDNVNRCFEIATGSPIEEGERNNECQDLIDSINR